MNVKDTAKRQYGRIIDRAAEQVGNLKIPREGWLTTMRKALGMSAPQLARRAGVTKSAIYQAERKEREGGITIRQMEKLASSLGGRFVYAIVPDGGNVMSFQTQNLTMTTDAFTVSGHVHAQARAKAEGIVRRASSHMALEKQSMPEEQIIQEIERLANKLSHDMPPDFWDE